MVLYGTIRYHKVPYGTIRYHMVPYGTIFFKKKIFPGKNMFKYFSPKKTQNILVEKKFFCKKNVFWYKKIFFGGAKRLKATWSEAT